MSQANVELVRGVYEAFGRGDVDAVFAAMEPDIEWNESKGMPYGGVYRGLRREDSTSTWLVDAWFWMDREG